MCLKKLTNLTRRILNNENISSRNIVPFGLFRRVDKQENKRAKTTAFDENEANQKRLCLSKSRKQEHQLPGEGGQPKPVKPMIHGEPQSAQDERMHLVNIVLGVKYSPKYVLKIVNKVGITTYFHKTLERVKNIEDASVFDSLKEIEKVKAKIKIKSEIIQL